VRGTLMGTRRFLTRRFCIYGSAVLPAMPPSASSGRAPVSSKSSICWHCRHFRRDLFKNVPLGRWKPSVSPQSEPISGSL